jgi:hypothetical protein
MQQFSTQSKLNSAHMTWEHVFQAFFISFSAHMTWGKEQKEPSGLTKATHLKVTNSLVLVHHPRK